MVPLRLVVVPFYNMVPLRIGPLLASDGAPLAGGGASLDDIGAFLALSFDPVTSSNPLYWLVTPLWLVTASVHLFQGL